MLIFLKYTIKTSILIVLFIAPGYLSYAFNPITKSIECSENGLTANEFTNTAFKSAIIDSLAVKSVQNDTNGVSTVTNEPGIPPELKNLSINFRVNSYISYYHLNHFINPESKRLFIQSWAKEMELQKLSIHTDSLRRAYSSASAEEREKISALILQSEERLLALNGEVSAEYDKVREEENKYWQSASMDEIAGFQQKMRNYQDSIAQSRHTQSEAHDTIMMFKPPTNERIEDKQAELPGGIIYKIQIGTFKGKIPEANNKLIKKLSIIRKVENHVDPSGVKVYTTGNLRSYTEAETMLSQVKQEGVKNATIVAYQNGKKISVIEARKLNK